ncbi:hypothetical protein BT96DRAFT_914995 [Gymnopus androsaceus JB14]|uniref:C2H2-type domain-containing protein n=1 Tax=Gymnopus androsaceus JB14 TaxID=1447944 RepID=A0A6A4I895_9AGAR|nr:hypothetical protein BT96DRAFT_914995 [Gymnopus androsaceus JB14]
MAQVKYQCSWTDCSFETLQKSNLNTHYRTHSQDKSKVCPDCDFRTCDPRIHHYVPKPRKARASKKDSSADSPPPSPDSESSTIDTISESVAKLFFSNGPPSNLDDLFFEPDFMYRRQDPEFKWDEIRRSPEPRPLSPAVESTPPLERFRAFHSLESELSLLLGNHPTSPMTLPYIDSQGPWDLWQSSSSIDVAHTQFPAQQLPPTPYDSALKCMEELEPTIPNFLERSARPMSPWSSSSSSSGSASPLFPSSSLSPPLFTGSLLSELYTPLDF